MIKEWDLVDSRLDRDYRIFKVRVEQARSPRTDKVNEFYTLHSSNWVNVVPVTPAGEVVMIRQYRHGTHKVSFEIPGGLVEEENPLDAAIRELAEETGYVGSSVSFLGSVSPNPALFDNLCHTYLVEGARQSQALSLDPSEDIEVELVPLTTIPSLIASGQINHALVIAAFHFYFTKRT
jgi:ADP-ribose pyrophosphatase